MKNLDKALQMLEKIAEKDGDMHLSGLLDDISEIITLASKTDWFSVSELNQHFEGDELIIATNKNKVFPAIYTGSDFRTDAGKYNLSEVVKWCNYPIL